MTVDRLSEGNDTNTSTEQLEQAWKMFDALFLDPSKKDVVAELFKGIPWLVREQRVQEAISVAKGWLYDLKSNVSSSIV